MSLSSTEKTTSPLGVERLAAKGDAVTVARLEGAGCVELQVGVRPVGAESLEGQVREIYAELEALLGRQGAGLDHVVSEKVFLRDTGSPAEAFRRIRAGVYGAGASTRKANGTRRLNGSGKVNGSAGVPPPATYLQEPPCAAGALCELQCRVLVPRAGEELVVRPINGLGAPAAGHVISCRGYDHIHLYNLIGGRPGDGLGYPEQMTHVFEQAAAALEAEGATFRDVVRTWIYVDEMERDYGALNQVRSAFFERAGVERMPASTGIQAGVYPADRGGAMDLYALRTERPVEVRQMHARTLNEAWSYGSAFSRGMTVTTEDRTTAYVSGTASIDERGEVVHVGDIEGQVNRMLLNVEQLLSGSGASLGDVVRATTYLKEAEYFDTFRRVCAEWGFPQDVPHTVCRADVCRPDWLCEMELEATV